MTVNPGTSNPVDVTELSPDLTELLRHAYLGTFRGPHGDALPGDSGARLPATDTALTALLLAQHGLAAIRPPAVTRVAVGAAGR